MNQFVSLIKHKFSSQFIRNLGWLSISELAIRVIRLGTTVLLAHHLSAYDYGLAAVVLATNEFVQVATKFGIGSKLIQVDDDRLDAFANSAYWLNWLVYGGLFTLQCMTAFPISWFYNDSQLIFPICATAIVYLIVPVAYIQATLIQRENRLKVVALTNTVQVSIDNFLTAGFAFAGLGMWAIVLPKVLVAPIWIYINYTNHPWRPKGGISTQYWGEIIQFGRSVLGIELLKTLRNNLDYLIVGRLIGVKELGIYYFAFNAGLGISLSFINAINSALYPHLCAVRGNSEQFKQRFLNSLKVTASIIVPVAFLQSSLAPLYVPIVFGQKWIDAIPVLILICLSAIPRPFADAASQVWLALDKPNLDLIASTAFTVIFALGLIIGAHWGVSGVAASVLVTHVVFQPMFTIWTTQRVCQQAKSIAG